MAASTKGKRRGKTRSRAGTMKRKSTVKRRNAPAKALADRRYRKRTVRSAKAYSRKGKTGDAEDEDL